MRRENLQERLKIAAHVAIALMLLSLCACKKESATEVPQAPDTTSHSYQWQEWIMGDDPESGYLHDAVIISDTLVYAGGAIHFKDSTGRVDGSSHNLHKWTGGASWTPYKVWFLASCSDTLHASLEIRALWHFSASELLAGMGGWQLAHLNGTHLVGLDCDLPASTEKLWASSNKDILTVGSRGKIARYDGTRWMQVPSPTTSNLRDVWGKGSRRWACGYAVGYWHSVLLRSDDKGASWRVLWQADTGKTEPFGVLVMSIWASERYLYIASDRGIYRAGIDSPLDSTNLAYLCQLPSVPYRIRGTADNNAAVSTSEGAIWHFNGATWREIVPVARLAPLYSLSVSEHLIVGVGIDASSILSKGRVVIARRM